MIHVTQRPAPLQRGHAAGEPPRRAGFTLLELLTVMTIMLIMLGLSVVAFRGIGRGAGMRGAIIEFRSGMSLARQYAITHRSPSGLVYGNMTNQFGEYRGFFVLTNRDEGVIGATNFLPEGVVFFDDDPPLVERHAVQFKIDGSCNNAVGDWPGGQTRDLAIREDRGGGMVSTQRIYAMTGRVRIVGESSFRN